MVWCLAQRSCYIWKRCTILGSKNWCYIDHAAHSLVIMKDILLLNPALGISEQCPAAEPLCDVGAGDGEGCQHRVRLLLPQTNTASPCCKYLPHLRSAPGHCSVRPGQGCFHWLHQGLQILRHIQAVFFSNFQKQFVRIFNCLRHFWRKGFNYSFFHFWTTIETIGNGYCDLFWFDILIRSTCTCANRTGARKHLLYYLKKIQIHKIQINSNVFGKI